MARLDDADTVLTQRQGGVTSVIVVAGAEGLDGTELADLRILEWPDIPPVHHEHKRKRVTGCLRYRMPSVPVSGGHRTEETAR